MTPEQLSWAQMEYQALREEVLALSEASRKTTRFYLPLAGAIYAAPYAFAKLNDALLWSICTAVSGLLLLGMTQSLFWTSDCVRRIGMYIKEVIEPRSEGGLMWEKVYFELEPPNRWWPGEEEFVMAFVPTLANLFAALGVGVGFLSGDARYFPLIAAAVPALVSMLYLQHLVRSSHTRKFYADTIRNKQAATLVERPDRLSVRMEPEAPAPVSARSPE